MFWYVLIGLWCILLSLLYYFFTCHFDHWEKKGVKFEKAYPLLGSIPGVMTLKEHMLIGFDNIYKKYKGEKFVGFIQGRKPALMILDPELIKCVMVKDFTHFTDHGFKIHEEVDPLEAKNLFNLEGKRWKEMRSKLSPTFTSGKIKMMTPLIHEVADELQSQLTGLASKEQEFDAKDIFSRFTTDVIGSVAFGIKCNSFNKKGSQLWIMVNSLLEMGFWKGIKTFLIFFVPEIGYTFRFRFISEEITNFFRKIVKDAMDLRKKTGQIRKDFIQLLIELKEKGSISSNDAEDEKEIQELGGLPSSSTITNLSDDDLTAQATVFFFAGFETSSTALSFASLELAANLELQQKLQEEIDTVLNNHGGALTYEALKEMKYMDRVIQETLRKYPPAGNTIRICTKNYTIPGTNIQVDKDTPIVIPNYSIQNDPKYFPVPENFDPERFSDENALHSYQYLHMPFGEGPRHCIGSRFALVQLKMGLASTFSKFDLTLSERTKYPPTFDPSKLSATPIGGIWLNAKIRSEE